MCTVCALCVPVMYTFPILFLSAIGKKAGTVHLFEGQNQSNVTGACSQQFKSAGSRCHLECSSYFSPVSVLLAIAAHQLQWESGGKCSEYWAFAIEQASMLSSGFHFQLIPKLYYYDPSCKTRQAPSAHMKRPAIPHHHSNRLYPLLFTCDKGILVPNNKLFLSNCT